MTPDTNKDKTSKYHNLRTSRLQADVIQNLIAKKIVLILGKKR